MVDRRCGHILRDSPGNPKSFYKDDVISFTKNCKTHKARAQVRSKNQTQAKAKFVGYIHFFFIFICLRGSVFSLEKLATGIMTNFFFLCDHSFCSEVYMKRQNLSGHAVSQHLQFNLSKQCLSSAIAQAQIQIDYSE